MARIGKIPISIPNKVTIEQSKNQITVKGPKGELTRTFDPSVNIDISDSQITVTRNNDSRQQRAFHGLTRALLNNMVVGVSEGFKRELYIEGVGYRAQMDGQNLQLNLGYSHPIFFEASNTIAYEVDKTGRNLVVSGIDKEEVGEIAARIRRARPPEPYKGKGVRYKDETIKRKAGKAGAK
jgi:large subunit ribosomal protein L6